MGFATLDTPFVVDNLYSDVLAYKLGIEPTIEPLILEMHRKNGLWEECGHSSLTTYEIRKRLREMVPIEAEEDKPVLAGSSVHFDLGFLRYHMPEIAARFSHRLYDVSAVKLFAQSLGMPKLPKTEGHRAVADILASIEDARSCAEWFSKFKAAPDPTNDSVPMRLPCPMCGVLHIDTGKFATKKHHTHACQVCGMVWRPAIVPTVGVQFLPGFLDTASKQP